MDHLRKTRNYFIVHTAIGVVALAVALLLDLPDGYRQGLISGIAGGFIATGLLGIISSNRLMKKPELARRAEIEKNEERTQWIRMKTHSAAYTVMLYIQSVGAIIGLLLGRIEMAVTLAALLFLDVILFVGFANYFMKKY